MTVQTTNGPYELNEYEAKAYRFCVNNDASSYRSDYTRGMACNYLAGTLSTKQPALAVGLWKTGCSVAPDGCSDVFAYWNKLWLSLTREDQEWFLSKGVDSCLGDWPNPRFQHLLCDKVYFRLERSGQPNRQQAMIEVARQACLLSGSSVMCKRAGVGADRAAEYARDATERRAEQERASAEESRARQQDSAALLDNLTAANAALAAARTGGFQAPIVPDAPQAPQQPSGVVSSTVGSRTGSNADIQVDRRNLDACIERFYDPNMYNWLAIRNRCSEPIGVFFKCRECGTRHGSSATIQPGDYHNTGLSADEAKQNGGLVIAVCAAGYRASLDAQTFDWAPDRNYICKKQ